MATVAALQSYQRFIQGVRPESCGSPSVKGIPSGEDRLTYLKKHAYVLELLEDSALSETLRTGLWKKKSKTYFTIQEQKSLAKLALHAWRAISWRNLFAILGSYFRNFRNEHIFYSTVFDSLQESIQGMKRELCDAKDLASTGQIVWLYDSLEKELAKEVDQRLNQHSLDHGELHPIPEIAPLPTDIYPDLMRVIPVGQPKGIYNAGPCVFGGWFCRVQVDQDGVPTRLEDDTLQPMKNGEPWLFTQTAEEGTDG